MHDEEQPEAGQLEKLSPDRIRRLMKYGVFDPHDGQTKLAGSRQDIWMDKTTGELYVAMKINSSYFEKMYINPRKRRIPGF